MIKGAILLELNDIERAALQRFSDIVQSEAKSIQSQSKTMKLIRRINTGSGFFSYLSVADKTLVMNMRSVSGVAANVRGLKNPIVFVLFAKDGIITTLEGAAVDESTVGIDFSNCSFKFMDI
jgi:hypothetical protein